MLNMSVTHDENAEFGRLEFSEFEFSLFFQVHMITISSFHTIEVYNLI